MNQVRRLIGLKARIHRVGIGDIEPHFSDTVRPRPEQLIQAVPTGPKITNDHLDTIGTQLMHDPGADASEPSGDKEAIHRFLSFS
jgi:hypothetical protein